MLFTPTPSEVSALKQSLIFLPILQHSYKDIICGILGNTATLFFNSSHLEVESFYLGWPCDLLWTIECGRIENFRDLASEVLRLRIIRPHGKRDPVKRLHQGLRYVLRSFRHTSHSWGARWLLPHGCRQDQQKNYPVKPSQPVELWKIIDHCYFKSPVFVVVFYVAKINWLNTGEENDIGI